MQSIIAAEIETKLLSISQCLRAITEHVTGPLSFSSKNGSRINWEVNPHQTVTLSECSEIIWKLYGFSMTQITQFWMFIVPLS